ncbi:MULTISPECIES: TetR/AcrR family transcriptional regulator [unclassified Variovorax]|uniref:TetR/AcrR family transcriptional regulator n=1 Tax=unclassified Variovorax TaxID=663243 RepID=UPI0025773D4C|nr:MULTISPECIES: TetR/AcrR family transcriptional regulator [unclassified Variovorax]MDM0091408.1 TetR/AcrR family transcriptional regulator [Variovorax sp. J22G40]MDM0149606.1 TetR/AcrR family transcriptional regulator [Variovorax sp. J2P1-31]
MSAPPQAPEPVRGEARRQQVLDAASACFRDHGFHGTSIQRISQAAGMSAGHIYHYFDNKEAIVTGIVEQYLHETLELVRRIGDAAQSLGIVEAVVAQVAEGIHARASEHRNGLDLEILAEASRNPVIAAAIQQVDKTLRSRMRDLWLQSPTLRKLPKTELEARITVLSSMFDGLAIRALCDPSMNKAATTAVVQRVFRMLMSE